MSQSIIRPTPSEPEQPIPDRTIPDCDLPELDVPAEAGARRPLLLLLLRLHFFAGVLIAPVLVVAALTGLLYAVSPTLERVVDHAALTAASADQRVPLSEQLTVATTRHPQPRLNGVIPGEDGATSRVLFTDESLGESYLRVVFVDPSNGAVRGDTVQYGSSMALPTRAWISDLHRRLLGGDVGRLYSELAASWLGPLALGGLAMWFDRGRRRRVRARDRAAGDGTRTRRLRGRPALRAKHAVLGSWIAVGLLVLSATGLTWSQHAGQHVTDLRTALQWSTPALSATATTPPGHAGHEGHDDHAVGQPSAGLGAAIGDQAGGVLVRAREEGLRGPVQLTPPTAESAPWRVKEVRRSWTWGPDAVSIDPSTGLVVERIAFADWPVVAKLTDWGIRVHMGFLFGLLNQALLAGLAVALLALIVRGYRMWWLRGRGRAFGRPPVRGACLSLFRQRPVATGLVAILVVAIGWAIPLLGISLAGFLVVDSVLGWLAGRADRA